jgi:Mn-dependent DtxR family transcriptional regulator
MTQLVKRAPPDNRKLRTLKRFLQNILGFQDEEIAGVAHVLPVEL